MGFEPGQYRREIGEVPAVMARQRAWLEGGGAGVLAQAADALRPGGRGRGVVVGMGSSLFAGKALETWAGRSGVPVLALDASRLLTGAPALDAGDRVLLVSQSGKTE